MKKTIFLTLLLLSTSFAFAGSSYAYDIKEDGVYCGSELVKEANLEEIEIINDTYAKDKNNVYYCDAYWSEYEIIENGDVETFTMINDTYAKDKNNVYYEDCWTYYCDLNITDINPDFFKDLGQGFVKDNKNVYYGSRKHEELDVDTFKFLNDSYYGDFAKDKNSVYYIQYFRGGVRINVCEECDVNTFERINNYYSKDKDNVYFNSGSIEKISNVDLDSFSLLSSNKAKDKNNYYVNGYITTSTENIKEINQLEQEIHTIQGDYKKNSQIVYLQDRVIYKADPDSFQIINFPYSKDDNNVFYFWNPIPAQVDQESFEILNNDYSKDKFNIYYKNNVIEEADVDTFRLSDGQDYQAEDKNYYYNKGEIAEPKGTEPDSGSDNNQANDNKLRNKLKGKIVLRVEQNGEAYYINPQDKSMHSLGRPKDAFSVMRDQGVGITNIDLKKIPIGLSNLTGPDSDKDGLPDLFEDAIGTDKENPDTDNDGHNDKQELEGQYNPNGEGKLNTNQKFAQNQEGKILLQVEGNGEAWYVNPEDNKRYFLGRPTDAFQVMRRLGLGISNRDFGELE